MAHRCVEVRRDGLAYHEARKSIQCSDSGGGLVRCLARNVQRGLAPHERSLKWSCTLVEPVRGEVDMVVRIWGRGCAVSEKVSDSNFVESWSRFRYDCILLRGS